MAQNLSRFGIDVAKLIWHVLGMDDTSVLVLRWHNACPFCTDHLGRSLSKCAILCGVTLRTISSVDRWMSKHDACWLSFYLSVCHAHPYDDGDSAAAALRSPTLEQYHTFRPQVPVHTYRDSFGNTIWRLVTPVGDLGIAYDAVAEVPPTPDPMWLDLPRTPIEQLPDAVLMYTLPSRYCQSDLFINDAWEMFGDMPGGWQQVQAVCDWLHAHITYGAGSQSSTSAWDSYQQRRGVCRDFAHLGVAFCRALNYPARYVCGYLPDIGVPVDPTPMDFHAWFEVYMDEAAHV